MVILAAGGGIMLAWNTDLPAPLLWAGYAGVLIGAGLFVYWWIGVTR